jgi:hypothetical protein
MKVTVQVTSIPSPLSNPIRPDLFQAASRKQPRRTSQQDGTNTSATSGARSAFFRAAVAERSDVTILIDSATLSPRRSAACQVSEHEASSRYTENHR